MVIVVGDALKLFPINYVEGEFYLYKSILGIKFGLWIDEHGEYHKVDKPNLLTPVDERVITEEQFNEEMEVKKQEILGELNSIITMADDFIAEAESGESERGLTVEYKKTFAGKLRLEASFYQVEEVLDHETEQYHEEEVKNTYMITLDDDLPIRIALAKNKETVECTNYEYGTAQYYDILA